MTSTTASLLQAALGAAVPLHIEEIRQQASRGTLSWEDLQREAAECGQIVAEQGDVIQYKVAGKTAGAFNRLAYGLACLAFAPGGVTFLDDHWEATWPTT